MGEKLDGWATSNGTTAHQPEHVKESLGDSEITWHQVTAAPCASNHPLAQGL